LKVIIVSLLKQRNMCGKKKLNLIAWTLESPFPLHTSISIYAFDYNLEGILHKLVPFKYS